MNTVAFVGLRPVGITATMRTLLQFVAQHPNALAGALPGGKSLLTKAERLGYVEWNPMTLGWLITDNGVHAL